MIPVDQSIVGKGLEALAAGEEPGDCLRACVASIMEKPIDAVPHFADTGPTHDGNALLCGYALIGWFAAEGVHLWSAEIINEDALPFAGIPGYALLGGPGPRGHRHCVVGYQGRTVHDPHPSRAGLVAVDYIDLLIPATHAAAELLARPPEGDRQHGDNTG